MLSVCQRFNTAMYLLSLQTSVTSFKVIITSI